LTFFPFTGKIKLGIVYAGFGATPGVSFITGVSRVKRFAPDGVVCLGLQSPYLAGFQLQIACGFIAPTPFAYANLVKEVRTEIWNFI